MKKNLFMIAAVALLAAVACNKELPGEQVPAGDVVTLNEVLACTKNGELVVGAPTVEGASVQAKVVEQGKADKIEVFKYKAVDKSVKFGFVAVAAGEGLENMFKDLGVDAVVTGGQTMNPSTEDILKAVHSVPAQTVFVLPNNKNIILAAELANDLSKRNVFVLPTTSIPQGISAAISINPELSVDENKATVEEIIEQLTK